MIAIIDYGLGNIQAFANIYKRLDIPATIVRTQKELETASRIILPGVGAFDWAMTKLNDSGMRDCLDAMVLDKGTPVLGVCVGMQMMANRSEEGILPGLDWVDAEVKKLDLCGFSQKSHLPHMGWNDVEAKSTECLFKNIGSNARFYFLHSYYFAPNDENDILSVTDYNGNYTSSIRKNNIFGTQFHPEKSHQWGIQLLKNFSEA